MKLFVHVFILTATALLFLSACNTMEGLGRDVKKGGEYIERKAGQ